MDALVRAACGETSAVRAEGPSVFLPLEMAQPLGMALRELATNALAHGALSIDAGSALLRWALDASDGKRTLRLDWTEVDGPPVEDPQKRGCGRYMIEDVLAYETDAQVEMSFPSSGLRTKITIPLGRVQDSKRVD